jgi:hypothetical protein
MNKPPKKITLRGTLPFNSWMIKLRRVKRAGHSTCKGVIRISYKIFEENSIGRHHFGDLGIDGMIRSK